METHFKFNQITIDQIKTQSVDMLLLHQALSKFATNDKIAFRWHCSSSTQSWERFFQLSFSHFSCIIQDFLYVWDKEEKEQGCIISLSE